MNTSTLFIAVKTDHSSVWQPELLYTCKTEDQSRLQALLDDTTVAVYDELESQLQELIKLQHPKQKFSETELSEVLLHHLGHTAFHDYGVWVYYPWSQRLVHLLNEQEFVHVRTNRNYYKITPEEQELLSQRKVGLIGLSVGQSVSVTMAMERGFGELRLADFDVLELTNLNRIRTGVHNLGLSKTISVAREIMEIDPFIKLKLFTEGLHEDNMDAFFTEGGKLDLLIDECDGLDIKVLCRHKARSLQVPVVMEASDRGMIDIERFDLEPDRPLLHGMIEGLDPEKLKTLKTNEEKFPYILKFAGLDTISIRGKASMLELGQTISTWPQLASAVTLGGGITADVVRRILLGYYKASGRYYVDVEELVGDQPSAAPASSNPQHPQPSGVSKPSWRLDYSKVLQASTAAPNSAQIKAIVEAACHAPSGGNSQPWHWVYNNDVLSLFHLREMTSSFLDYDYNASYFALGASLENAILKAAALGYKADPFLYPNPQNSEFIAQLSFHPEEQENKQNKYLGEHVYSRETNRNIEVGPALTDQERSAIKSVAQTYGSRLYLIEDAQQMAVLSKCIAKVERLRMMHSVGHQNFIDEIRWTQEAAEQSGDGIDIRTVDLTVPELTGFRIAKDYKVIKTLQNWGGGAVFEELSKKSTAAATAIGIITREEASRQEFFHAGRDLERAWIAANAVGLGFQPQSPMTFLFQRLRYQTELDAQDTDVLDLAYQEVKAILSSCGQGEPMFVFRLFKGQKQVVRSMRRKLEMHFEEK